MKTKCRKQTSDFCSSDMLRLAAHERLRSLISANPGGGGFHGTPENPGYWTLVRSGAIERRGGGARNTGLFDGCDLHVMSRETYRLLTGIDFVG